jgi:uncharacterized CHY-type Zn-finger protein
MHERENFGRMLHSAITFSGDRPGCRRYSLSVTPSKLRVLGLDLDPSTRCKHWHGPTDIIAIKMKCCGDYYACKDCHEALAGHALAVWPEHEWNQKAILCGACGVELSIRAYMQSGSRCPSCDAGFNPGCRNHYHFYFERSATDAPSS